MAEYRKRYCGQPGCPNTVTRGAYCPEHARARREAYDGDRGSSAARGYDSRWRAIRDAKLADCPRCERCTKPATLVHHRTPKRDGGTDAWANLESVCASCHQEIHAALKQGKTT